MLAALTPRRNRSRLHQPLGARGASRRAAPATSISPIAGGKSSGALEGHDRRISTLDPSFSGAQARRKYRNRSVGPHGRNGGDTAIPAAQPPPGLRSRLCGPLCGSGSGDRQELVRSPTLQEHVHRCFDDHHGYQLPSGRMQHRHAHRRGAQHDEPGIHRTGPCGPTNG
jgi:hypothetical protein